MLVVESLRCWSESNHESMLTSDCIPWCHVGSRLPKQWLLLQLFSMPLDILQASLRPVAHLPGAGGSSPDSQGWRLGRFPWSLKGLNDQSCHWNVPKLPAPKWSQWSIQSTHWNQFSKLHYDLVLPNEFLPHDVVVLRHVSEHNIYCEGREAPLEEVEWLLWLAQLVATCDEIPTPWCLWTTQMTWVCHLSTTCKPWCTWSQWHSKNNIDIYIYVYTHADMHYICMTMIMYGIFDSDK